MINILQIWRKAGIKQTKKLKEFFSTLVFNVAILFFIIGFGFTDTPIPFGWYQQFMPNLNNQPLQDICFVDSLTGYAITQQHYILKTINSGDNWNIIYNDTASDHGFTRIQFMNTNTGFVGGGMYYSGSFHMLRTTDGGNNWTAFNTPVTQIDISILNIDTFWIVDYGGLGGGIYQTTNGGLNWNIQYSTSDNPNKIYMFNSRIGFACTGSLLLKTTNSGQNWSQIGGSSQSNAFFDMYFVDSLTGWKCSDSIRKTTNSGLNWYAQILPYGGNIVDNHAVSISVINKDTIWSSGGLLEYPNLQTRGLLYRTTNSGINWMIQIPDTTIHHYGYYINFINKLYGWGYGGSISEIHTTSGGDTAFSEPINKISSEVPSHFLLFQNYPNPFNPVTKIKYLIKSNVKRETSNVRVNIYDISGKMVKTLVNGNQEAGEYEVSFDGFDYSSGVYFYSLFVEGNLIDTKRMVLLK